MSKQSGVKAFLGRVIIILHCLQSWHSSRPSSVVSDHGFAPHNGSVFAAPLVTVEPNTGSAHSPKVGTRVCIN